MEQIHGKNRPIKKHWEIKKYYSKIYLILWKYKMLDYEIL